MADESSKISEVSEEVLAPEEQPRENLVTTAVKFLQNPKVQSSPLQQRRAFLEKKGLSKEEIELAISRAGITQSENLIPQPNQFSQQILPVNHAGAYPPNYELSKWQRVGSWTKSAVAVAAVAYAGYHLYTTYLKPLFLGQETSNKRIDRLEKQIQDIQTESNETMKQIQDSLKVIQAVLTQQQIANSAQTTVKQHDLNSIGEIKTEIQSLKGLLLNRRQFAPVPTLSPGLPSWQLSQATDVNVSTSPTDISSPREETVNVVDSQSETDLSSSVDNMSVMQPEESESKEVTEALESNDGQNLKEEKDNQNTNEIFPMSNTVHQEA